VDKEGNQVWVVVVKASFVLQDDGTTEVAPAQEPVCWSPQYSGEPGQSSLLREGELVTEHPGTDVTLLGTAYAPDNKPVPALDVRVSVGGVNKTLRVFGNRLWQPGVFAPRMTDPEPFTAMPITYERAYGGTNVLGPEPGLQEKEPRNPIGTGFASRASALNGKALPNVEDPDQLIRGWDTRPRPVGLGPIPAMWSPRLEYAGTFDEEWSQKRMPLLPRDYDPRQAQSAHPDLVSPRPLRGGEEVVLTNLTPDSHRAFRLPRVYLTFLTYTKTGRLLTRGQLDRVILEPDAKKVVMIWRSSLNCRARVRDVMQTVVETKPFLR
jgi:hypothetical protein